MKKYLLLFAVLLNTGFAFSQEICNNGIDDDGDGLVDLNDTVDCVCQQTNVTSMLTNPSFEDYIQCPTAFTQTTGYIVGWSNGSYTTPDYCNTNCGFTTFPCLGITPYDGAGMLGFLINGSQQNNTMYMEYISTCLNSPMIAGTTYTYTFYVAAGFESSSNPCTSCTSPLTNYNLAIYGSANCADIPFGVPLGTTSGPNNDPDYSGQNCPPSNWTKLGVVSYNISATWTQLTITFTPNTNINAILIGGDCPLPVGYPNVYSSCKPYFYIDKLEITTSSSISSNPIGETGSVSSNNLVLNGALTAGATSQWFHNGIALTGETGLDLNYSLNNYPDGTYSFVTYLNGMCAVSTIVISSSVPVANAGPDQNICGLTTLLAAVPSTGSGIWTKKNGPGLLVFTPPTSPNASVIASIAGAYTLLWTETSASGLSSSDSVLITLNQPIIANAGLDTTICKGDSVVLTASGGTTYLWNGTVGGSSSSINVSPSVTTPYQVTVSGNGCSDTDEVIVHVNNTIANAGQDTSICIGTSAILHATGGSQYQWSNMQTTSSISVSPISDSTFYVTVTNNSCVGLDSVKVKVNPSPVANAGADQTICEGDTLQLIANGGGTYLWSGGLGTSQIISIQPASSITYTVTVTLNGCTDSDAINVTVNALPQITMSSISETCNMSNGYAISIVEGGSGIYNYIWNTGDLGPSIKGISQGIYTVTVEDTVTHCSSIGQVSVNHISGPDAYFVISNHTPLVDEESVSFTDYSTGSLTTWLWTIEGLTSKTSQNFNYVFETSDYYVVSLSIVDTNGCTDIYIDSLRVREGSTFYIPNAFSPNGDEDNESFGPEGDNISPEDYQMIILNRWGNVMFSTNNFAERWNGTKDNKGTFREAKEDVYVYQIRVRGEYNVIKEYVGKVILLK
ncbi:MAG: gliding motility-associated C-terminal domain-containing protein [Bacteroidota bacterium]